MTALPTLYAIDHYNGRQHEQVASQNSPAEKSKLRNNLAVIRCLMR